MPPPHHHHHTYTFPLGKILLSWLRTHILSNENYSGKKEEMKAMQVLVNNIALKLFAECTVKLRTLWLHA